MKTNTNILSANELRVLNCMINATLENDGFILDELECSGEFSLPQLKGFASSLQAKGFIQMFKGHCYNDGAALL